MSLKSRVNQALTIPAPPLCPTDVRPLPNPWRRCLRAPALTSSLFLLVEAARVVDPTLPPDPPDQVLLLRGQGSTPRISCCVEGNWAAHTLTLGFPSWRLDTALEQATGQNEWERQMSQAAFQSPIMKRTTFLGVSSSYYSEPKECLEVVKTSVDLLPYFTC